METLEIMPGSCKVLFKLLDIRRTDKRRYRCLLFPDVKVCDRVENKVLVVVWETFNR